MTNKTETITIRCTPYQKRKIQKAAKGFDMSVGKFCLALTRVFDLSGREVEKCVTKQEAKNE